MELHPSVRNIVNRVVTELKGQPYGIAELDGNADVVQSVALPSWIVRHAKPGKLTDNGGAIKFLKTGVYSQQDDPANGDRFYNYFICDGTETRLQIGTMKGNGGGKFDIYVNGVLDSAGYDDYGSGDEYRNIVLTESINNGKNIIEYRLNGKNASSFGYYLSIYGTTLQ